VKLDTGEIEGAKFVIARPAQWSGCVLLLAHGFRDPNAPLVADLDPNHLACRTLLEEGWIVATTSYRRNGMIIRDAIADIENLRERIASTCGEPRRVLLEGDAMGGAIVTLIAEQFAGHYQGAVAVGPALQMRGAKDPLPFNLQPQIPVVFLCTQNELDAPRKYLSAPYERQSSLLLLEVSRDGRLNVSQRERLLAIRTLIALIEREPVTLPTVAGGPDCFDATQEQVQVTSQVRLLNEGGFEARVTDVTVIDGDLVLNAQPSDFSAADIAPGTRFEVVARGKSLNVLYGRASAGGPRGSWIAFPDADGFFRLICSGGDAATITGLGTGDPVVIRRLQEGAGATPP
jgi:pimeloyl-ACP methyl ester carboxylesterase